MINSLTILIVEDEALIAENLKFTLEDLGFSVSGIAYTFEQALAAIDQIRPDLTLLDIHLNSGSPAHTGLALAVRLRQDYQLPFIFLTAYDDQDTIRQATRLQPSGYLIKPVSPATLFAAVQTAIESRQAIEWPGSFDSLPVKRPDFFFVKVGNRTIKLHWHDVYCLEASKNYVQIRLIDNPVTYTIRGTLNFVRQQLVPESLHSVFQQFNRSMVINVRYITHFDTEAVYCSHLCIVNTRLSFKEVRELLAGNY